MEWLLSSLVRKVSALTGVEFAPGQGYYPGMRLFLVVSGALLLAGCSTPPVTMVHPETGKTAQCGGYKSTGLAAHAGAMREAQCIQDFKEQGYVRQ